MSYAEVLSAVGLIRTSRRRGFCPACRLFQTDNGPQEVSAPALMALGLLLVAAAAWVVTVARMKSMDASTGAMPGGTDSMTDATMGLGPLAPFVAAWSVMMVAMMFPSATPLVFEFARHAERRRGWRTATALLSATYLGVWLVFGVVCYAIYVAIGMPWPQQSLVGGVTLILAGLYALTPLKRASEARCRQLCALHGPLPFNLMRSAVVAGGRYAVSCMGCTGGLMLAMLLIGTSNLAWMIAIAGLILVYKLAPLTTLRRSLPLAAAVMALGVLYAAFA